MSNILIKKLETADAALLSQVAIRAYSDHYLHLWYDEGKWYKNTFFSSEKLYEELTDTNAHFYLAYYENTPVGFLKLNIDAALSGYETQRALELERIYLNQNVAGKGIGRALIEHTFRIAKEYGKSIVWLKAMDTSAGPIAFYKKMGFEITGTFRLKHQLMKEELRGMVIMVKSL
jgi:GNAT superfamily N-acetyltransferase